MNETISTLEDLFGKYRISEALMTIYNFEWDDFCSWYLEMIKPDFEAPIDRPTFEATISNFEKLQKLLHPFMPFITEEIWHSIRERNEKDCIIVAKWPEAGAVDKELLSEYRIAREVVSAVRNVRAEKNIKKTEPLQLLIIRGSQYSSRFDGLITRLANLNSMEYTDSKVDNAASFVVKDNEYYIPMEGKIDVGVEVEKIREKLEYQKGFLISVDKKLSNQGFVNNAKPEIVEKERQKKADAESQIKILEESLANLRKN